MPKKSQLVEQLKNGVRVRCADGAVIPCRPLPLGAAMEIIDAWKVLEEKGSTVQARSDARFAVARLFLKTYPELAKHISLGDVDELVPGFFWGRTGATVLPSPARSTGTPSASSMPPNADTSPTS